MRQLANVLRTAAVMAAGEGQIEEHHLSDDFLEDARSGRAPQAPQISMPIRAVPATSAAAAAGDVPTATPVADPLARAPLAAEPVATGASQAPAEPVQASPESALPRTLGEAEVELIRSTLAAANGNISVASKRLGISRNTIYRKLRWGK